MRRCLSCINNDNCADFVGTSCHLLDRIHSTQRIGDIGDRNDSGILAQKFQILVLNYLTAVIHWDHPHSAASLLSNDLPRHNIRMVFHFADQNLVTGFQTLTAVRTCNQIQSFGGSPDKDDLPGMVSVDKLPCEFTGIFERFRCAIAQRVHTPMNIGML